MIFAPPDPVLAATSEGRLFPVRRLFCIGRNYAAHAREMGRDPDAEPPFFFTKWAEAVVPSNSSIAYPALTRDFQFEAELVVALSGGGRNIAPEQALDHVYGYAAGLDMTRRDLQADAKSLARPWDVAKNFEQSAPLGIIRPASEMGHPQSGSISLKVDGDIRQSGDLSEMIWPVADVIAYISRFYRLEPGDLIYTGTPAGVGPVAVGQDIAVLIEGLDPLHIHVGPPAVD